AQSLSRGEGLSAHDCLWPGALASGLYGGGQCGGFDPLLWGVSTRGIPAGAVVSRPWGPHRWLRQHDQEYANTLSWSARRQLPAPRAQPAPEETRGHHLPGPQGLALPVPHLAVPGTAPQALARVCTGPAIAPFCRPRLCNGWNRQRRVIQF